MGSRVSHKGFTLIELLIVVAIIGILAAIAIPNFLEAQVRAKVAKAKSEMRNLHTCLEAYRIDDVNYPPDWNEIGSRASFFPGDGYVDGVAERHPGSDRLWMTFLSLSYLTTPTSYISNVPDDAFFTDAGLTYDQIDTGMDGSHVESWLLASMGPDRTVGDWRNGWVDPIGETSVWYDASNGTVSDGDIIRTPDYIHEHLIDY